MAYTIVFGTYNISNSCLVAAAGELSMVGIMRQLASSEHHILLDSSFHITGCTQASFDLLGIQQSTLQSSAPLISNWFSEWSAAYESDALHADAGSSLFVKKPKSSSVAVNKESDKNASSIPSVTSVFDGDGVWIVAHVQHVVMPTAMTVHILHWVSSINAINVLDSRFQSLRIHIVFLIFLTALDADRYSICKRCEESEKHDASLQ